MTEVIYNELQFFIVLLTIIWLFFIMIAVEHDKKILYWLQLGLMIPLFLLLVGHAYLNSFPFGYLVSLCLILASIYFAITNLVRTD